MGQFKKTNKARHADREAASHGLFDEYKAAPFGQEPVGPGGSRRRLPAIIGLKGFRTSVPMQDKGPTADPGRLRLDQCEHHLRGNRRIDGAAALGEYFRCRFGRQRICCHSHIRLGVDELFLGAACRSFRLGLQGVGVNRQERLDGQADCKTCEKDKRTQCHSANMAGLRLIVEG